MKSQVVAVVLGAGGQDGYYLTRHLALSGRKVKAIVRRTPSDNQAYIHENVEFIQLDIAEKKSLEKLLSKLVADEIYHLAAVHGSQGETFEQEWPKVTEVNTNSLHTVLEYCRLSAPKTWVFYASSCRVFGPLTGTVSESSPMAGNDLYAISKISACKLFQYYQSRHNIGGTRAILFQHESPRRASSFFSSRIAELIRRALLGQDAVMEMDTLDFFCDWGSAEEYMAIALTAAENCFNGDMIFATGKTVYTRALVEALFQEYGLNYKQHIAELKQPLDISPYPPPFVASIELMRSALGVAPRKSAFNVFKEIVEERRSH